MIKILTGWGNPGGSTVAHINLVNAFNEFGLDATLYSPHDYHQDKCQSGKLNELVVGKTDIIIGHFLDLPKFPCKKQIFSCHESNIWNLKTKDVSMYSKIHYVSKWQQEYHSIKKSYFVIPNIPNDLVVNTKPNKKIGGVIGSIDFNKQTHKSIVAALEDGCELIYVFGNITDMMYFEQNVASLICDKVVMCGHVEKQTMYDMVTDVYQSSLRETWGYVASECEMTGTKYHNFGMCNFTGNLPKEEIVKLWKKEIGA